jgi:tRNA G18 (ribose-2'-O)-methylase SpoU
MALKKGDMETNFEVRSFDVRISPARYRRLPAMPIYVILDNLRSAFNVGAIFRLCDTLRVRGLFLCGYTAHPPHVKLEKTALGTIDYVPWRHFTKATDAVGQLIKQRIPVYAAETTAASIPFHRVQYPSPVAFVFGNEALGVSQDVLRMCHGCVEIPMYGYKNSLNVAAAAAIVTHTAAAHIRPAQVKPAAWYT